MAFHNAGSYFNFMLPRKIKLGLHEATMRADDHQLQQPLVVSVMDRAGAPGVKHDVEGSGFGFRTLRRLDANAVTQPFQCRMQRPE